MVLEHMHQVFKHWLEKDTHDTSHLTSVGRSLARDWLGRLYSNYSCWKKTDGLERQCAELSFRRPLLRKEADGLDVSVPGMERWHTSFRDALEEAFREPVLSILRNVPHLIFLKSKSDRLVLQSVDDREADETTTGGLTYL